MVNHQTTTINNVAHQKRNVFIEILETGFCGHAALVAGRTICCGAAACRADSGEIVGIGVFGKNGSAIMFWKNLKRLNISSACLSIDF